jgi:hypothetical protein
MAQATLKILWGWHYRLDQLLLRRPACLISRV